MKSKCHQAELIVRTGGEGTSYYECSECGKLADPLDFISILDESDFQQKINKSSLKIAEEFFNLLLAYKIERYDLNTGISIVFSILISVIFKVLCKVSEDNSKYIKYEQLLIILEEQLKLIASKEIVMTQAGKVHKFMTDDNNCIKIDDLH